MSSFCTGHVLANLYYSKLENGHRKVVTLTFSYVIIMSCSEHTVVTVSELVSKGIYTRGLKSESLGTAA